MDLLTPWRSQPVFVTSTFQDMQAERDHLLAHVFPAVDEWLATRRRHLEWVDLRIGAAHAAEDEATRESKILSVCLDEVRRARPFVIALLGDRYGWVPPTADAAAAVAERGFATNAAGRSVTDLEIEFGVLHEANKAGRSLVFLRAPLPYDEMPPEIAVLYSDGRASDAEAPLRVRRLAQLKARLLQQAPDRCFEYGVEWDRRAQRVARLDEWGRAVEAHLRAALDQEFGRDPAPAERPWEELEAEALAAFIEQRTRGFVGRKRPLELIDRLLHVAGAEPPAWAVCISGEPGAGKTALFGEIYKRLIARGEPDRLVLVHAVGASAQGASIRFMLRRLLHDLVVSPNSINWFRFTESGEIIHKEILDAGLADNATEEQIYAAFRLMLTWAAEARDVVVIVDAIDQFDPLAQATFVTWAERHWPRKARLVVTTQPTAAAAALCDTAGVASLPLAPLDEQEARSITTEICSRYHRRVAPAVMVASVARRNDDDVAWSPACQATYAVSIARSSRGRNEPSAGPP